ncbi:hypothetical protein BC833DRAFT_558280 [Globomyces pollinis-pini]|nr:hypothetical protein BC833DRAFT_558280 [Globomyces pollinis-pini]
MNSVDQLSLIPAVQDATIDSESVSLSHKALRKLILDIQKDESLTQEEKARKVQNLMCKSWLKHRNQGQEDLNFDTKISSADIAPSYYDYELGLLGCKHYQRAVKIQAHCCGKWFTCRFCHDEVSDHTITRTLTKTMICMHCKHVQPASQHCENESCGKKVAKYYCDTCKLWDNEESKHIYHCNGCGICRIGKGLDIDYFHCDKCNVCMAITLKDNHKCIERNLESDCPICGEFMFTSTTTVMFMVRFVTKL